MLRDLPPQLQTTPTKCHAWLSTFAALDDAPDQLAELLDGTTKRTIELCVAAIRERAEYLTYAGYTEDHIASVRHVAYWLESAAGHETMAILDERYERKIAAECMSAATDGEAAHK